VIRALALAAVLTAGCAAKVIELGGTPDAGIDARPDAASACRCRITPCRVSGDCALIGGACGPDFYCVGDFGACTADTDCQATVTSSVCTAGATSTVACGS